MREFAPLGMDLMFFRVVFGDGRKCIQAYMQGYIRNAHAFDLQLFQQARCKVKPGSGRGGRTGFFGIDRLIAFGVAQLFVDVRRQGDIPHFGEMRFDGFGKTDEALGAFEDFEDLGLERWEGFGVF